MNTLHTDTTLPAGARFCLPSPTTRRSVLGGLGAAALAVSSPAVASVSADADGALRRAEQIVRLLREHHVCEGFKLDEQRAARTLKYMRRLARVHDDDVRDDDPEEQAALAFFIDHGQSLDWVFCGDAGGMICRRAAQAHGNRADAELLDLGRQFRLAVADVCAERERLDALLEPRLAEIERNATWPEDQALWTRADAGAYNAAYCKARHGTPEIDSADAALSIARSRQDKIQDAILELTPRTTAGIGVVAMVARETASHWWNEYANGFLVREIPLNELDFEVRVARQFIESVGAVAGVELAT